MIREQLGAVPLILTTRLRAARYPALSRTALSGGATLSTCAAPIPLNTSGNGPLASRRRKSENIVRAGVGISRSVVRSTAELFTCDTTPLKGEATRTEPITQAMSSTESTLTTAPPTLSRKAAGRHVMCDRRAVPMAEAANCPMMASRTRITTATRSCWFWPPTMAREIAGANSAPATAPPRKPAKLRTPTTKPCR